MKNLLKPSYPISDVVYFSTNPPSILWSTGITLDGIVKSVDISDDGNIVVAGLAPLISLESSTVIIFHQASQ